MHTNCLSTILCEVIINLHVKDNPVVTINVKIPANFQPYNTDNMASIIDYLCHSLSRAAQGMIATLNEACRPLTVPPRPSRFKPMKWEKK